MTFADNFAYIRGKCRAVIAAVSASPLEAAVHQCIEFRMELDPSELTDLVAPALLSHFLTTTAKKA